MDAVFRHVLRCFFAGVIAVLPVGGLVLTLVWMEDLLAESWLAKQDIYFPGMGILAAAVLLYVVGLVVSTFLGRWIWRLVDGLLKKVPALGKLYATLKQILGYDEGPDAIFQEVVLVPSPSNEGWELALVTQRLKDASGAEKLQVFVPGAPSPTSGRLILVDAAQTRATTIPVNDAFTSLLSVGATAIPLEKVATT